MGKEKDTLDFRVTRNEQIRALVLHPELRRADLRRAEASNRSAEATLEEAIGLAQAIELQIVHAEVVAVPRPKPATLLGEGVVQRVHDQVEAESVDLVVVDTALTPVQQRNLETAWGCKVIDRTGLILEIFGARARTNEGKLQVDLASLSYQRSRLVRSWTHLERQRGGAGFMGGPGERQLEIDRRLIDEKIVRLKGDLEKVKRTRELHRSARKRVPYPIVALVGYTNAGKSTLFNRLTASDVRAQDLLFATLDPTMRRVQLPSGKEIILSDTVGFISDLPTDLIAAFRATLEEVTEADVIVHVRDIVHADTLAQRDDVLAILKDLNLEETLENSSLEAWNKADLLDSEGRTQLEQAGGNDGNRVICSAASGEGCDDLLEAIDRKLAERRSNISTRVALSDGATLAWLYRHGDVRERHDEGEFAILEVGLEPADAARFERRQAGNGN
ncbi:GTPase HflX [Denitrobaculum tricleocarpae]|uniref:GTPase HflX n=1 Tax=Denitrobaculum tricleocarpae TaxID=2591009 RepID=A0A545TPX6_9PROT|nr:GTPase HflX [Denitrobaculum tricleocarpae]TQV79201.1 GTPase HflX [Denitrobaculum tricleocarpae]